MRNIPSRFRRLDEILADLPFEDSMLVSELDGYLTGVAICPEPMTSDEWLPPVWGGGYGEPAPFEDPIDAQLIADMVVARHAEIVRDLRRGKPQPIFDVDRNGDILWEIWIEGFEQAMELRPDSWSAIAESEDEDAMIALAHLLTLVAVAADDPTLDSMQINELTDKAHRIIPPQLIALHAWRARRVDEPAPPAAGPAKVGRNDPCPCGSGKKHKRCCGAN
jgi:uncharacterized protein